LKKIRIIRKSQVQTILAGLPHLSGKPILPSNFRDKVEVITFFTSWCPHCQVKLKLLKKLYAFLSS